MSRHPKGVLEPGVDELPFQLSIRKPPLDLEEVVEHCWTVRWDLRGRPPFSQHVLTHPAVHLVAERGRSAIFGVTSGRFTRLLEGHGRAFGVRFRPAGFHRLLGSPVSALTDRTVPILDVFGPEGERLADRLVSLDEERHLVDAALGFVRRRLGPPDPQVEFVNRVVANIMGDRSITRVDHVGERWGLGRRALQRLFREYVGVSPKWVIQRYRLHEAAERLSGGERVELADLAVELGYFDQAHFARDFRAVVGRPPAAYARGGV